MYKFSILDKISFLLVIIGGLNWGLMGLFNCNLVSLIFGEPANLISRIIYILVGISALNMILFIMKAKKKR